MISPEMRAARLEKLGRRNLKQTEEEEGDDDDYDNDDDENHSNSFSDSFSLLGGDRARRKRQQVESIVQVLREHDLHTKSVVVDFGSGSGNLCLALAR